jgi:membrane-associated phospholipid phosphatase
LSAVNRARTLVACVLAVVVAFVADRWAYDHVLFARVYDEDWGRLFRIVGFVPTWLAVALGVWLQERGAFQHARRRAFLIAASPLASGAAAEILKLLLRRERPATHDGEYVFRAFSERTFSTGGLALPSSHTMVAFGGAAMLAYMYPRTRWLWFTLAAGCALSRVLARAHFLSDVTVGAVAALATTGWLWHRFGRNYFLRSV